MNASSVSAPSGPLPAILLVEDNPDDATLIHEAYVRTQLANPMAVARDGVEALSLALEPPFEQRPGLVLLDLMLPKVSGLDVLVRLRSSPRTKTMPIVVFSSSSERDDIRASYEAGANSYLVKPLEFPSLEKLVRHTVRYWLAHNERPPAAVRPASAG